MLRLKGKPESNITSNYVDTGDLPASHQNELGLELLANRGPFSVLLNMPTLRAFTNSVFLIFMACQ